MVSINLEDVCCQLLADEKINQMDNICKELEISIEQLKIFLTYPQNLGFIALYHNEIIGFIYGYSLTSLDGDLITDKRPQLFIYSVDILPEFQGLGVGTKLFQYVVDYSKTNNFSECFVITDKGNKAACKVYEKAGGKNDYENEIVYVIKNI